MAAEREEEESKACAICFSDVPDNPLILNECRHIFCATCIFACYGANSKVVPCNKKKLKLSVDPKCPICRQPFALKPTRNGVQFLVAPPSSLQQTECSDCNQPLERKGHVVEHLTRFCSKAEMSCPLCAQRFQINHFDAHLRHTCLKVPCTCCALVGPWAFIKAHNANFNVNNVNVNSAEVIRGLAILFRTTAQPLDTMRVCAKLLGHAFTVSNGFEGQLPDLAAISAWRNQLPPLLPLDSRHHSQRHEPHPR